MNTTGRLFKFTSFGESHGLGVGGIIDGMPAQVEIDLSFIQGELDKRRPHSVLGSSPRREFDKIEIISGVYQGKTLGSPILFLIRNQDAISSEYAPMAEFFRPSHADDTYFDKYGIRDERGGGRSSARETAARVAAGAFAMLALNQEGIKIQAYTQQLGSTVCKSPYTKLDLDKVYQSPLYCPEEDTAKEMQQIIEHCREVGDTIGGCVFCVIKGAQKGLGEPIYDKLTARLASAMMGINASRGFEIGQGFSAATMLGSEHNDRWIEKGKDQILKTEKNLCGGIRGGISTGEDIYFRVAFKAIPSLRMSQQMIDSNGHLKQVEIQGRHDISCVPRAVPIVEAMAAITVLDMYLLQRANRI